MNKKIQVIILSILCSILFVGCNKDRTENTESFIIQAKSDRFQGKLVSSHVEQYEYDLSTHDLLVTNGQKVPSGKVLLAVNENSLQSQMANLRKDLNIDATLSSKEAAEKELNYLLLGNYSLSDAINAEFTSLVEQIAEIKTSIRSQEIVIETAEITYQYELAALENSIQTGATEQIVIASDSYTDCNNDHSSYDDDSIEEDENVMMEIACADSETDELFPENGETDEKADSSTTVDFDNSDALLETELETEKLTKLYEKEKENNYLQLEKLNEQYKTMEARRDNFSSSTIVQSRIRELEEEILEYERIETDYNRRMDVMAKDIVTAQHSGIVVIESGIIYVYSDEMNFVFTTHSNNLIKFLSCDEKYSLQYHDSIIGKLTFSYYIPKQDEDMYDLVYTIEELNDTLLLTNSYAYMVSEEEIIIPSAFVREKENGELYVIKDGEEVTIKAEIVDGQYRLISGVFIGDTIEKIN